MSKKENKSKKKPIEQYEHKGKERLNNPPVGLVDAHSEAAEGRKRYAYDPHLDPTLQWAGKAERTSFEIPTVSLHVHERIDPRTILEAVRKRNGSNYEQLSLFSSKTECVFRGKLSTDFGRSCPPIPEEVVQPATFWKWLSTTESTWSFRREYSPVAGRHPLPL